MQSFQERDWKFWSEQRWCFCFLQRHREKKPDVFSRGSHNGSCKWLCHLKFGCHPPDRKPSVLLPEFLQHLGHFLEVWYLQWLLDLLHSISYKRWEHNSLPIKNRNLIKFWLLSVLKEVLCALSRPFMFQQKWPQHAHFSFPTMLGMLE